jgi:hypothetical protein
MRKPAMTFYRKKTQKASHGFGKFASSAFCPFSKMCADHPNACSYLTLMVPYCRIVGKPLILQDKGKPEKYRPYYRLL